MISPKLFTELNSQLNFEISSAHIYLAMKAYFSAQNLDGFVNFFTVQIQEENLHASKFYDYINTTDGTVVLEGIPEPIRDFSSILDIFQKALAHEKKVTARIYHLMDTATEEKEHATISFLKWFIDEQVEEESTFTNVIRKLERVGNDPNALYALDAELAQRQFVPPAPTAN